MNSEEIYELVEKAKLGDYESAMQIVNHYKGYAKILMSRFNIQDKVSCYDEIISTILNCIIKFK